MFLSGFLGGALGYIVAAPFFMASRIAQAEVGVLASDGLLATGVRKGLAPTAGVGSSSSGLPILAHLAKVQGLRSLWRGADVLVARGAIMSATQLTTYDMTKGKLKEAGMEDGPVVHSMASLVASFALTTAICPADVVYTSYLAGPSIGRSFSSPFDCAKTLLAEGGMPAMFRGWVPLWLRFLPSSVLTFLIYERMRKLLIGSSLN